MSSDIVGPLDRASEGPTTERRSLRALAVELLGPVTILGGVVWAIFQPYRIVFFDPAGTVETPTLSLRRDRNWDELLQELRVTQTGTQILTGFLLDPSKKEVWGRPVGLLQLTDGSLLVSDDGGNLLWRITFKK